MTFRSVAIAVEANRAKSMAEPIAVRPTKERGAALRAAAKAFASSGLRMTVQSTTTFCSLAPAHST